MRVTGEEMGRGKKAEGREKGERKREAHTSNSPPTPIFTGCSWWSSKQR
jgi:hypothetical protein